MKTLHGHVMPDGDCHHRASGNLEPVMHMIEERMGIPSLVCGTLNIRMDSTYIVQADAYIRSHEWSFDDNVKLQRCVISGIKAIIMRPDTHEMNPEHGHGPTGLELMATVHLRTVLQLNELDSVAIEVEGDDEWWDSRAIPVEESDSGQA